ncbi:MAG: hypothetical protein SFY68_04340 [Candidatus Sumerlaeia bacterium]|nr:hypothetical protein [Candidatus Sumerlaeia bacterium]
MVKQLIGSIILGVAMAGCTSKSPGEKMDLATLGTGSEVYVRAMATAPKYQEKIGDLRTVELISSGENSSHSPIFGTSKQTREVTYRLTGTKAAMDVSLELFSKNGRPWVVTKSDVKDVVATTE